MMSPVGTREVLLSSPNFCHTCGLIVGGTWGQETENSANSERPESKSICSAELGVAGQPDMLEQWQPLGAMRSLSEEMPQDSRRAPCAPVTVWMTQGLKHPFEHKGEKRLCQDLRKLQAAAEGPGRSSLNEAKGPGLGNHMCKMGRGQNLHRNRALSHTADHTAQDICLPPTGISLQEARAFYLYCFLRLGLTMHAGWP